MREVHYDYIKSKYGNKSKLLFTDIDNWVYKIGTKNAFDNFNKNKEMFAFCKNSDKLKYYLFGK